MHKILCIPEGTAATSGETLREFFDQVTLTPSVDLITGKVCGVRVEEEHQHQACLVSGLLAAH